MAKEVVLTDWDIAILRKALNRYVNERDGVDSDENFIGYDLLDKKLSGEI